eukprot:g70419.t1
MVMGGSISPIATEPVQLKMALEFFGFPEFSFIYNLFESTCDISSKDLLSQKTKEEERRKKRKLHGKTCAFSQCLSSNLSTCCNLVIFFFFFPLHCTFEISSNSSVTKIDDLKSILS